MKLFGVLLAGSIVLAGCSINPIDAVNRSGSQAAASSPSIEAPQIASPALPTGPKAPPIKNQIWLNVDTPLSQADLNGKVILIDFWTFS